MQKLTDRNWLEAVHRQVVVIHGVEVAGSLDFGNQKLFKGLELSKCDIMGDLDLTGSDVVSGITITDCHIHGSIMAGDLATGRSLILNNTIVDGDLDLERAHIGGSLELNAAHVQGAIKMPGAQIDTDLDLSAAVHLACAVDLSQVRVNGNVWLGGSVIGGRPCRTKTPLASGTLELTEAAIAGELVLSGAKAALCSGLRMHVGGLAKLDVEQLDAMILHGATFDLDIELGNGNFGDNGSLPAAIGQKSGFLAENMTVKGRINAEAATLAAVNMAGSTIHGDIDLSRALDLGPLNFANLTMGGNLSVGRKVTGDVNLNGAHIDGNLYLTPGPASDDVSSASDPYLLDPPWFGGQILAYNMKLGGSAYLGKGVFEQPVKLILAKIGQDVMLNGSTMNAGLDIGGVQVGGQIREWPKIKGQGQVYSLRDAVAGSISDTSKSGQGGGNCNDVPPLDLQGFAYSHFGASNEHGGGMMTRDPAWYTCALEKDPTFTLQPYRQAAAVFRKAGDDARANAILRAANWRSLDTSLKAQDYFQWLQTVLLGVLIGWGLGWGYAVAIFWLLIFTCWGAVVLRINSVVPQDVKRPWLWSSLASLTHFIPFLTLDRECDDFLSKNLKRQTWWVRGYFALHAGLGYLIGTCLAAALAGLTQAS